MLPGSWEVKQISGADYATVFWRKAINARAHRDFVDDRYEDPYWGLVTRQTFLILTFTARVIPWARLHCAASQDAAAPSFVSRTRAVR